MLAAEAYGFRNQLLDQGITFAYSGYMTEQILTGIGGAIRRKMELDGTDRNIARTVFSIFVEQVQNIIRYSAEFEEDDSQEPEGDLRYGVLTVGYKDGTYFVCCSNMVERRDVERLRSSLEQIKSMDKIELKKLFKETLRGETPEGSKGAGVGFIEIARRAKKGFEFDFSEVSEDRSYFILNAFI